MREWCSRGLIRGAGGILEERSIKSTLGGGIMGSCLLILKMFNTYSKDMIGTMKVVFKKLISLGKCYQFHIINELLFENIMNYYL